MHFFLQKDNVIKQVEVAEAVRRERRSKCQRLVICVVQGWCKDGVSSGAKLKAPLALLSSALFSPAVPGACFFFLTRSLGQELEPLVEQLKKLLRDLKRPIPPKTDEE